MLTGGMQSGGPQRYLGDKGNLLALSNQGHMGGE
jgi:hypothetical protein